MDRLADARLLVVDLGLERRHEAVLVDSSLWSISAISGITPPSLADAGSAFFNSCSSNAAGQCGPASPRRRPRRPRRRPRRPCRRRGPWRRWSACRSSTCSGARTRQKISSPSLDCKSLNCRPDEPDSTPMTSSRTRIWNDSMGTMSCGAGASGSATGAAAGVEAAAAEEDEEEEEEEDEKELPELKTPPSATRRARRKALTLRYTMGCTAHAAPRKGRCILCGR